LSINEDNFLFYLKVQVQLKPSNSGDCFVEQDFEIFSIRNKGFYQLIDFLRFLALPSALGINHIGANIGTISDFTCIFDSDKTTFFGMLKIEAVAFRHSSIDSRFDPCDVIDQFVAPFVKKF